MKSIPKTIRSLSHLTMRCMRSQGAFLAGQSHVILFIFATLILLIALLGVASSAQPAVLKSLQTGTITMSGASVTATITAVDTTKAWLVYTYNSANGTGTNIGQKLVSGQITNATTLTFDRNNTGQTMNLTWYLVQFTDATTVQRGSAAFNPATQTQADVTITGVSTAASIAVGGYSMRGGRSPDNTQGEPGVFWFTLDLTSATNLRIPRG